MTNAMNKDEVMSTAKALKELFPQNWDFNIRMTITLAWKQYLITEDEFEWLITSIHELS